MWDFTIQIDKKLDHSKPDILVGDKIRKERSIVNPLCPFITRRVQKMEEKVNKYELIEFFKLAMLWKLKFLLVGLVR